jgi:hypothetical protein
MGYTSKNRTPVFSLGNRVKTGAGVTYILMTPVGEEFLLGKL